MSTLWTNTGVGQNFQRDLGAIGPYEFQGKVTWTNPIGALFKGKSVRTNGPESVKITLQTGIGPWMALSRFWPHWCLFTKRGSMWDMKPEPSKAKKNPQYVTPEQLKTLRSDPTTKCLARGSEATPEKASIQGQLIYPPPLKTPF